MVGSGVTVGWGESIEVGEGAVVEVRVAEMRVGVVVLVVVAWTMACFASNVGVTRESGV